MKYIIVFITASSKKEAETIANALIDSRLAACVNILPHIESIFIWQGKKDTAKECLLIAKTKDELFNKLKQAVKKLHSYDTPEIISIPIKEGNKDYLNWIEEVLQK